MPTYTLKEAVEKLNKAGFKVTYSALRAAVKRGELAASATLGGNNYFNAEQFAAIEKRLGELQAA